MTDSPGREVWDRLANRLVRGLILAHTRFDQLPRELIFIASGRAQAKRPRRGSARVLEAGSLLRVDPLVLWARGPHRLRPLEGAALTDVEILSLPPAFFLEVFGGLSGHRVLEALLEAHDMQELLEPIVQVLRSEPRLAKARLEHLYKLAESATRVRPAVDGSLPERTGSPPDFDVVLEGSCRVLQGPVQERWLPAPACLGLPVTLGSHPPLERAFAGPRAVIARVSGKVLGHLRATEPDFDQAVRRRE